MTKGYKHKKPIRTIRSKDYIHLLFDVPKLNPFIETFGLAGYIMGIETVICFNSNRYMVSTNNPSDLDKVYSAVFDRQLEILALEDDDKEVNVESLSWLKGDGNGNGNGNGFRRSILSR
ncbi:hypothetical protein GOV12_00010 [Candidatus Pacearchaeota archaeon]|nr:hypothetical protein [Candidatus Pacearchaeota archaeon]